MSAYSLGALADPACCHEPIDISGVDRDQLSAHLRRMVLIRIAEQHLARQREAGVIGGPVHLGVGQEAIAVGVSAHLRPTDMVFGAHRSHSHLLALGSSVHGLFAEVLGKDTGLSRGMGGSMHLWDGPRGFFGSVPIMAGTVPLAVGAALAIKLKNSSAVSVSYLGDGAVEEGAVHESMNLARVTHCPVLFVVENNFFASHMEIHLRQPLSCISRFAAAHDIPFEIVDGNDVVAVDRAAARAIAAIRSGGGPRFVEAVTFRWYGHVDWREDIDVGVNRSVEHLANWRARDPVARLTRAMAAAGWWSAAAHDELLAAITTEVEEAWARAMSDPWPDASLLLDAVYLQR
ncbi:MAG TPA: thiamine pyrophosphate-dependent dehydrogenase E1 component subunit alpha [Vicinamibacterales bacterium]|nr:thiamine pyrophosphate-dependent dehydrogenase E1 component subunit alpha [Vicinamibacterales bacterium]